MAAVLTCLPAKPASYLTLCVTVEIVKRLLHFLQELHFVQQLEPRMKAGAGKLQELLSQGLAQALKEGNVSARIHCLQAFAAIGDASGAEKVR